MGLLKPIVGGRIRAITYERLQAVDAAIQEQWLLGSAGDLGRRHSRVMRR
jgi:hypothetical protein